MTTRDDDIRIRLGRIRDRGSGSRKPDTFIGEVMRAAKKAGHVGNSFARPTGQSHRSRFGRGRGAALSLSRSSRSRRVLTKAHVVRHTGSGLRSAALSRHVVYLKRDGVTHDGADARMFDARSDAAEEQAFSERCRDDRHHFRIIVSPEDAAELESLRTFTRELMADVEPDLGTRLDWIAVDHWNTDNPHVHILIRGRADDGKDLVISRAYISQGFRERAAERVTLELGPRTDREIRSALEREAEAERWTNLDRALRDNADAGAGIVDLRPGAPGEDPELRRLMIARATKLERLGLAEQAAPACWTLKPTLEDTLRQLAIRGDIIKTMHQAMSRAERQPGVSGFALHGEHPAEPVLGRLCARGGPIDEDIHAEVLYSEPLVVIAGAKTAWAHRRRIELADLSNEAWTLPPEDSLYGSVVAEAFHAATLTLPRGTVFTSVTPVRNALVATGRYLSIRSRIGCEIQPRSSGLQDLAHRPADHKAPDRRDDVEAPNHKPECSRLPQVCA